MNPHKDQEDDISLCKSCWCMTHTLNGDCGKCGASKDELDTLVRDFTKAHPMAKSEARRRLIAWRDKAINQALDNIEASVKQHTVPEGPGLVTRSYVTNTLEFERQRLVASKKVGKQ